MFSVWFYDVSLRFKNHLGLLFLFSFDSQITHSLVFFSKYFLSEEEIVPLFRIPQNIRPFLHINYVPSRVWNISTRFKMTRPSLKRGGKKSNDRRIFRTEDKSSECFLFCNFCSFPKINMYIFFFWLLKPLRSTPFL